MVRLSHSAVEKYKECPKRYYFHYIRKLRENLIGSPLFYGGAIDDALNEMLKTKMPTNSEEIRDPEEVFIEKMTFVNYNRETIELPFTCKTKYSFADFDQDILEPEDIANLAKFLKDNGYKNNNPIDIMSKLQEFVRAYGYSSMEALDQMFYNYCCWTSLCVKGIMMIDVYKKEMMPRIKEVISIQKKVEIKNEEGDLLIGYIDFVAILEDETVVRICDNKTSSKKYKPESVSLSQQLGIYCEGENLNNGAFFVLNKKVRKTKVKTCQKCGEVTIGKEKTCKVGGTGKYRCKGEFDIKVDCSIDTQIIVDEVSEEQKDITFGIIDEITTLIKNEEFPKNQKDSCFFFGQKCCYSERCWGKDQESLNGLVDLKIIE